MVAVPRKATKPLTFDNARGVQCSRAVAKIWSRTVRTAALPVYREAVRHRQHGGVPLGGTEFCIHMVQLHLAKGKKWNRSVAALFVDLRSAFYSVLLELTLGQQMPPALRTRLLALLDLSETTLAALEATLETGAADLQGMGLPAYWTRAIADFYAAAGFRVTNGSRYVSCWKGTKPGCPLADLLFGVGFFRYQSELVEMLRAAGLLCTLPRRGDSVVPDPAAPAVFEGALPSHILR